MSDEFKAADRTPEIGVQVEWSGKGYYINVFRNRTPYTSLGPFPDRISLPDAMRAIAVELRMAGDDFYTPITY